MSVLGGLLAAEAPNGFFLPGDPWEAFWSSLAFVIVAYLLYRFAWSAIVNGFKGRTTAIENELRQAEAARAEAERAGERVKEAVANAEAESERIRTEAEEGSVTLREQLRQRADEEVAELRRRAEADIAATRNQAVADLRGEVSALTAGAAEAVVRHNLDEATQAQLIDQYIDRVGARN